MKSRPIRLGDGDALIVVDVQNDFLPGGSLAVADAEQIIPVLNGYIEAFNQRGLPVVATRDWHPREHCSFESEGGPWPPHCIAGTIGAAFASTLNLPRDTFIVSKAQDKAIDVYSGFDGTELDALLQGRGVLRVWVGGLTTDYCVLNTVKDALTLGYSVCLLTDAVRAVEALPGDGARAVLEMTELGARAVTLADLAA
jgi:nicotinamidase/pyrazinamidase